MVRATPYKLRTIMKVYVVFLFKKDGKSFVEETIGVRRSSEAANRLLGGRYGGFVEYDTKEK